MKPNSEEKNFDSGCDIENNDVDALKVNNANDDVFERMKSMRNKLSMVNRDIVHVGRSVKFLTFISLFIFILVMGCMFCVAWTAAILAKDTTTSAEGYLLVKNSNEVVVTKSTGYVLEVSKTDSEGRRLEGATCTPQLDDSNYEICTETYAIPEQQIQNFVNSVPYITSGGSLTIKIPPESQNEATQYVHVDGGHVSLQTTESSQTITIGSPTDIRLFNNVENGTGNSSVFEGTVTQIELSTAESRRLDWRPVALVTKRWGRKVFVGGLLRNNEWHW